MIPSDTFDAVSVNEPPEHIAPPPLTVTADGNALTVAKIAVLEAVVQLPLVAST